MFPQFYFYIESVVRNMAGLIYDENALVNGQMYKYTEHLHARINKYTGAGRTIVTYYNIDDSNTTTSLGFDDAYQIIGPDSPLRYQRIKNFVLIGMSPLNPDNGNVGNTNIRNYNLSGEAFIIPGTVMPKENDFFIINHLQMNHLIRITEVFQDGLNTDGSYRVSYQLYTTEPSEIHQLDAQVIRDCVMDMQTIGGSDLTPVIGENDYTLRHKLIKMVDDMVENYIANYYDHTHNCFLLHLNGKTMFDLCGNAFMARTGIMIRDNAHGNIVLNPNKIRSNMMDYYYQRSPYKWIERDAPARYLDTFKYQLVDATTFPDSSFAKYGTNVDIMIPGESWCQQPFCEYYFPPDVYEILNSACDIRCKDTCDCEMCRCKEMCNRHYKLKRFDYISLIHDFIYGKITSIQHLSPYIGDQLFDNSMSQEVFLWTPIIIYIIKNTLKIQ